MRIATTVILGLVALGADRERAVRLTGALDRDACPVVVRVLRVPPPPGFPEILAETTAGPGPFRLSFPEPEERFYVIASGAAGSPAIEELRPPNSRYRLRDPIRLGTWRTVSIRVTDGAGAPVAGARVVRRLGIPDAAPILAFLDEVAATGEDGRATVRVPEDAVRARLSIAADGFAEAEVSELIPDNGTLRVSLDSAVGPGPPEIAKGGGPPPLPGIGTRVARPVTHPPRGASSFPSPPSWRAEVRRRDDERWQRLYHGDFVSGPTEPGVYEVRVRGWLLLPTTASVLVPEGKQVMVPLAPAAAGGIRIDARGPRGVPLDEVTTAVLGGDGRPVPVLYTFPGTEIDDAAREGERIEGAPNGGVIQLPPGKWTVWVARNDGDAIERQVTAWPSVITRLEVRFDPPEDGPVRVR